MLIPGLCIKSAQSLTKRTLLGELAESYRHRIYGSRKASNAYVRGNHTPSSYSWSHQSASMETTSRSLCFTSMYKTFPKPRLPNESRAKLSLHQGLQWKSFFIMNHFSHKLPAGLVRLVLIGDVHRFWDAKFDAAALQFLRPDAVLFVGDFGEEEVDLISSVAALQVPKAVILGNHDAWGPLYLGSGMAKVNKQLDLLGKDHVAYSSKRFKAASGQRFSVIGGRPFSDGNASMDHVTARLYGPQSMGESARLIKDQILAQAEGDPVILMAHNGPRGLGSRRHDPCGKDFRPEEGDYGDPDLREGIEKATASGRRPALVTFGHMHESLHKRYGSGLRNMVDIGDTGTVYLNCAVVPRHKKVPGKGNLVSHFVSVLIQHGHVIDAENVWLGRSSTGEFYTHAAQKLVSSEFEGDTLRQTIRLGFDDSDAERSTLLRGSSNLAREKQEL